MKFKTIDQIPDVKDKRIIVRADFNVPIGSNDTVEEHEAWRITTGMATINTLTKKGAKVIIISHIGNSGEATLKPVAAYIDKHYRVNITFSNRIVGDDVKEAVQAMETGDILMLENLRKEAGETENSAEFAKSLAELADIYVNDAFAAGHRKHASIVGIPRFIPGYAGIQFAKEYESLGKLLNPERPFVVCVGGVKFGTKIDLIKKYTKTADTVIVGGALAHAFYRAEGIEIGKSFIDLQVDVRDLVGARNLKIPRYVVVECMGNIREIPVTEVRRDDTIVDMGKQAVEKFALAFKDAKTILWNGPFGYYESGYSTGTLAMADALATSSAYKVVGGGNTVSVIRKNKREDVFDFVSTAGGAMLEFLERRTLPAIEALSSYKST